MKILKQFFLLLLGCMFIVACEQESFTNVENPSDHSSSRQAESRISMIPLKVSPKGYLIFQNQNEVEAYTDFLANATLDEVITLFNQYNFKSLNSTDFDKNVNPEKFTFDKKGLVQIGNHVFKISDDGFYLLSAKQDYMNDAAVYQKMVSGNFQPQMMNKFSLFKDRGNADFNILDIVDGSPSGIHEDEPPMVTMGKFWGKEEYPQACNGMGKRWVNVVHRCFWIKTWVTGYYEDC